MNTCIYSRSRYRFIYYIVWFYAWEHFFVKIFESKYFYLEWENKDIDKKKKKNNNQVFIFLINIFQPDNWFCQPENTGLFGDAIHATAREIAKHLIPIKYNYLMLIW